MQTSPLLWRNTIKQDLFASIVVALVALPLCLGIALACGLPPSVGILSGIIGGLLVGLFAGCPLQVSGPAAGLVTIVIDIIHTQGLATFGLIVFMAGVSQLAMGLSGLGPLFRAVSPALVQGMLSGIGVSILFSQLHIVLGLAPKEGALANITSMGKVLAHDIHHLDLIPHQLSGVLGLLTVLTIIGWSFLPKAWQKVPAALVAILLGVGVAALFHLDVRYIEVPKNLFDGLQWLSLPAFSDLSKVDVWVDIVAVALIASTETLLTAVAVDKLAGTRTDYNKELVSQGLGNSLAGFMGLLPITGVIVRSAANIQEGGKTRLSTMLHGLWLLLFIVGLPFLLTYIPVPSLAAILVYASYKLIDFKALKRLVAISKLEFIIYAVTLVAILSTNLLEGILMGFAAALLVNLFKASRLFTSVTDSKEEGRSLVLRGNLSFLHLPRLEKLLKDEAETPHLNVDVSGLFQIDHACIELLWDWASLHGERGQPIALDWEHLRAIHPNFGWEGLSTLPAGDH